LAQEGMDNGPDAWAVICGSYINAYSIARSLRDISWQGHIVCLKDEEKGSVLAQLFGRGVEVWTISPRAPRELVSFLAHRIPPGQPKVIFFTDERFHEAFRGELENPTLKNARFFVGSVEHLDTILDRYAFYEFITKQRLAEMPRTIPGCADPWSVFREKFCMKPRRSWDGLKQLPRVSLISRRDQLSEVVCAYRKGGHTDADWCYQELLSCDPRHNVSICGWHDRESRQYFATRHCLRHPPRTGNGDVSQIIEPPPCLVERTEEILIALCYEGPFELEFLLDRDTNTYKVLELNPRFWMQHALVEAASGQALVRRYLGLPPESAPTRRQQSTYWINTIYALSRLLRGDLRIAYYLCRKSIQVPDWLTAVRWLPRFMPTLARRLLKR